MARTISATEAQAEFDELIELIAENDETVVVEQDGVPRVVFMSVTAYRQFSSKAAWESWEAQLANMLEFSDNDTLNASAKMTP